MDLYHHTGKFCQWAIFLSIWLLGCSRNSPPTAPVVPKSQSIAFIEGEILDAPDLGLERFGPVRVPQQEMRDFLPLITPHGPVDPALKPDTSPAVSVITINYSDSSVDIIQVKHTGHNPAALSVNGGPYYYGGTDRFPDGGIRICRLLKSYSDK